MKTVLFTQGMYSDYCVLGAVNVPDDFDLDQARKEFMDIIAPRVSYEPYDTYYERMYEAEKEAAKQFSDYKNRWDKEAVFVQWLTKEKGLEQVDLLEINLDDELKLWEKDRP